MSSQGVRCCRSAENGERLFFSFRRWGATSMTHGPPALSRPPRCYDEVRVCLLCSQFFDESNQNEIPTEASYCRGKQGMGRAGNTGQRTYSRHRRLFFYRFIFFWYTVYLRQSSGQNVKRQEIAEPGTTGDASGFVFVG